MPIKTSEIKSSLNDIKIDLAKLRMQIAQLQKDGFSEIGLEDFLRFMHTYYHSDEILEFIDNGQGVPVPRVPPLRRD